MKFSVWGNDPHPRQVLDTKGDDGEEMGNTRCGILPVPRRWHLHEGLCHCQLQAFRAPASTHTQKKSIAPFLRRDYLKQSHG